MRCRLLMYMLVLGGLLGCARASGASRYQIAGNSMAPTYPHETVVAIEEGPYIVPKRGELVLFQHPTDADALLVKRVIGLPNERVQVVDGVLLVDERPLNEPYLFDTPSYTMDVTVEVGTVLLLGDNRNNSFDSHVFGAVSLEMVKGRVTAVCTPTPCVEIDPIQYDQ